MKRRILALLLALCLLTGTALAADRAPTDAQITETVGSFADLTGQKRGSVLGDRTVLPAGSAVSDWTAMALALSGARDDYGAYLAALRDEVEEQYAENGGLDKIRATEYHRIALTVLALGGDPTSFGTDGEPIDLIADGTYNFAGDSLGTQGLNGWIFALIALDASGAAVPADARFSRETMVSAILSAQEADGGFGLTAGSSDADLTAMALQALAPDRAQYGAELDRALTYLSGQMSDSGAFPSGGTENAETTAQVILALCALGIDPAADARFQKGEQTPLTGLRQFRLADGSYVHTAADGEGNLMATEQALLALLALQRLQNSQNRLYDFSNYDGPASSGVATWIWIAAGAAALCTAGIWFAARKRRQHAKTDR
ncbi:MAG: prenyltransferase/squalene oxidase repeat-containing protein [Oscillospiraceae bacterium]|nr:prenyltransferase/squalene oxidase repeat-containing protein [Oscillospiraceae bacterium]